MIVSPTNANLSLFSTGESTDACDVFLGVRHRLEWANTISRKRGDRSGSEGRAWFAGVEKYRPATQAFGTLDTLFRMATPGIRRSRSMEVYLGDNQSLWPSKGVGLISKLEGVEPCQQSRV